MTLEMIQNRRTLDEVVMAPSYILREAWQLDDSRSFGHFLGLSLSNLLESDNQEKASLSCDQKLAQFMKEIKIEADAEKPNCRADWNLTNVNIQNELDRND